MIRNCSADKIGISNEEIIKQKEKAIVTEICNKTERVKKTLNKTLKKHGENDD